MTCKKWILVDNYNKKYYNKDFCKLISVYGRDDISLKSLRTFGHYETHFRLRETNV